jgi:hypothetical protein
VGGGRSRRPGAAEDWRPHMGVGDQLVVVLILVLVAVLGGAVDL